MKVLNFLFKSISIALFVIYMLFLAAVCAGFAVIFGTVVMFFSLLFSSFIFGFDTGYFIAITAFWIASIYFFLAHYSIVFGEMLRIFYPPRKYELSSYSQQSTSNALPVQSDNSRKSFRNWSKQYTRRQLKADRRLKLKSLLFGAN